MPGWSADELPPPPGPDRPSGPRRRRADPSGAPRPRAARRPARSVEVVARRRRRSRTCPSTGASSRRPTSTAPGSSSPHRVGRRAGPRPARRAAPGAYAPTTRRLGRLGARGGPRRRGRLVGDRRPRPEAGRRAARRPALALDLGELPLRRGTAGRGPRRARRRGTGRPRPAHRPRAPAAGGADVVVRDRLAPDIGAAGRRRGHRGRQDAARAVLEPARHRGAARGQGARGQPGRAPQGRRRARVRPRHRGGRRLPRGGLPVEVVPGVSSALGVPALAGIPVTAHGVTQSFTVVSAHLAPGDPGTTVDWDALARLGGTLVLLMADGPAAGRLRRPGRRRAPPRRPVAVVRTASLPTEGTAVRTLARRRRPRRGAPTGRRRGRGGRRTAPARERPVSVLLGVAHGSATRPQQVVRTCSRSPRRSVPGCGRRRPTSTTPARRSGQPSRRSATGEPDVTVLPLLLTPASHSKTDVAASVQAGRRAPRGAAALRPAARAAPGPRRRPRRAAGRGRRRTTTPCSSSPAGRSTRTRTRSRRDRPTAVGGAGASRRSTSRSPQTTRPSVPEALDRLRAQGATRGRSAGTSSGPASSPHGRAEGAQRRGPRGASSRDSLGASARLARLVAGRFDEALAGDMRMNCDGASTARLRARDAVGALQAVPHAPGRRAAASRRRSLTRTLPAHSRGCASSGRPPGATVVPTLSQVPWRRDGRRPSPVNRSRTADARRTTGGRPAARGRHGGLAARAHLNRPGPRARPPGRPARPAQRRGGVRRRPRRHLSRLSAPRAGRRRPRRRPAPGRCGRRRSAAARPGSR